MTESDAGTTLHQKEAEEASAENGLSLATAGFDLSRLSSIVASIPDVLPSLVSGKIRFSIFAGVVAGLLVMFGFLFFDANKEEWMLKQKYPNAVNSAERRVLYSQELLQEGEFTKAEGILRVVLEGKAQDASRADALLLLAQAVEKKGDGEASIVEARELYQKFLSDYPADSRASAVRLQLARNYAKTQYFQESNAELERLLDGSRTKGNEVKFLIARNYYDARNVPQAAKILKHIIQTPAQTFSDEIVSRDARLLLGRMYAEAGKAETASSSLKELIRDEPGTPHAASALRFLAQEALEHKTYPAAIDYCRQWFLESPLAGDRVEMMLLYGSARLGMGEPAQAVKAATEVVTFFPDSRAVADAFILQGNAFESLGRAEEAEGAYREAIVRFPQKTPPLKELARLKLKTSDLSEAIRLTELVCRLDPHDDPARVELAKLYWENGENVKALELLEDFTRHHRLSPEIGNAFLLLAQVQADMNLFDAAHETLDLLLAVGTTTIEQPAVFERQGDLFMQAGLHADALAAYRTAQENGGKWPHLSLKIAEAVFAAGRAEEALQEASAIDETSLEPGERYNFYNLQARAYIKQGDFQSARRLIHKAVSLKTGRENFAVLALLMQTNLALKDEGEAARIFDVTRKLIMAEKSEAPLDARQIAVDWADYLYKEREYRDAAEAYSLIRLPQFTPSDSAWALCQQGNCYYQLGERVKAGEAYSRLQAEFPESEFKQVAKQRQRLLGLIVKNSGEDQHAGARID
jgi:tetratricopeptide (TPR) repeat protein